MTRTLRRTLTLAAAALAAGAAGCGGPDVAQPPSSPTPPVQGIASAYILPNAPTLKAFAFGDEPIVIYKGERMRWVNLDATAHAVVADRRGLTDFDETGTIAPGDERSFVMTTIGTTTIHCAIHPEMVGTLVVRER